MNVFVSAFAGFCAAHRFEEKRLVAPSRRVGNQWLDAAARAGHPALNVHVETLRSFAVDLAAPFLESEGLAVASRRAEALLVERLLREPAAGGLRYLGAAVPGQSLAAPILSSLVALRLHGVSASRLRGGIFRESGKAADLRLLAREYESLLATERLADYARVLQAAIDRLSKDPDALGKDAFVLVPEDHSPSGLEKRLLEAVPAARLVRLAVDPPGLPAEVRFACAVGEGNEVRGVLRACLERGLRLDEVEVLHTDPAYATAFVETFAALERPGADEGADATLEEPVTYAEGLPCTLARPGRALLGWLRWMADGYPQPALVAMLREGLLETGEPQGDGRHGVARLAELLRAVPIGRERGRYLDKIDESLRAARTRLEDAVREGTAGAPGGLGDEGRLEESPAQRRERLERRVAALETLRRIVAGVLEVSPAEDGSSAALVAAALGFLETCARSAGRFDAFAAQRLREELEEMGHWLGRTGGGSMRDVRAWLEALPGEVRVAGSGPRPGRIHLDHVSRGGHSGRPHTFVIGLDDGRFPGAGAQDPLLLDAERRRLDETMPTAAARLEQRAEDFRCLLGRVRGTLTLSWSSRAVVEDADRFPSQAVLDVFRTQRGARDAGQDELLRAAGLPASFAPDAEGRALDRSEWRLWRFTGGETVANASEFLARRAPHLERGGAAAVARAGDCFTPWDGRVPAAGADLDPASPAGKVLSSNGLETAGACPRRFFYRYALEIEPPEELPADPARWLDPRDSGSLLHELFEEFVREILGVGRYADIERARETIHRMLERKLAEYASRFPIPSRAVFARERERLVTAADTFVREESQHVLESGSEPAYLEASLGMPAGGHATALDHPDPVLVELPDGRTIRARGRVDRVDHRAAAGGGWVIWDYKTGGTFGYDRADPYPEGRKIQPYLYLRMVERRLRESVDRGAEVRSFGYFFPGAKGRGERLAWERARLAGGGAVLAELCAIIAGGAFAATTDDRKDCAWCDYRRACGDVAAQAAASRRKILSGEALLAPLARLRARSLRVADAVEGGGA